MIRDPRPPFVAKSWPMRRLRHVATFNPSKAEVRNVPRDTEVSFLPMESIGDDGKIDLRFARTLGEVEVGYTYMRDDDVVEAKITPCFENGKGAVVSGLVGGIGFGTTELTVIRAKPGVTFNRFLYWLFASAPFRSLGEAEMYGAGGQKRVPDEYFRDFAVALPPIQQQRAIANYLDRETAKIDRLTVEQQRLIELLNEKRQAVISTAVTKGLNPDAPTKSCGAEWPIEVPGHWDVTQLKYSTDLMAFIPGRQVAAKKRDEALQALVS